MSRAVVVGGSIAGMCVARVLTEFFDDVVIVDRDRFPIAAAPRSGVPQSRHAHALLGRGQLELEALFPGFVASMRAAGALLFDAGLGLAVRRHPGWQAVGPNGVESLWSSRDLLEHTVRSLLLARGKVRLHEGCQVIGLLGSPARVTGVRVRFETAGEQELPAGLVVDASGRGSKAEAWLGELGVSAPELQRVDARAAYASRFYAPPPPERRPASWWWKGLWVEWQRNLPRGALIFPIENGRWLVTAAGIGNEREYPPTDEQGFLRFLYSLSSPAVAHAVEHAEPLSPISGNRSMANLYRRYDRWTHELPGFVAVGDAVCAFNPIYGQGMSASAASASILRAVLRRHGSGPGFTRVFFRRQADFLSAVWNLATSADFQWPTTEGERPKLPPGIPQYVNLALECAHKDAEFRRHLMPVFDLTGSITRFFEPQFVAKVCARAARERLNALVFGAAPIPDSPPLPA